MSGMCIVREQPERSWGFARIDREFAIGETVWGYERLGRA